MKINELKNIVPLKYNSFYSVHKHKFTSKNEYKNLPMIKTFSRNFNNDMNNVQLTLTKENKSNKNILHNNSINNTQEVLTKGKMSKNNFFRLTNYIKNKYAKNITKIKNKFSTPNKVKEIQLNVNRTEYDNNFNRKCFRIEAMQSEKPKKQKILNSNKNKYDIDKIYNYQKEEYKNIINSVEKRKKFLNKYSSIIYYQIFPNRIRENQMLIKNIPNFFNFYILKNLKKFHNTSKKYNENLLIHENSFFEMIIENVTHKVEYKNQRNERITISLVKNLLDEEIKTISYKLNIAINPHISKFINESKINKSTSTNELPEYKFLNKTYDKFSYITTNTDINLEQKIKKNIENKLITLNEKYGFINKNDNIFINEKNPLDDDYNTDNQYQNDTENDLKIKSKGKRIFEEDDDENNIGDLIWNMANDINNIDEYKKRFLDSDQNYIFENTKIRNIFGQHLFKKINNKKEKVKEFGGIEFTGKKNIDFKDFGNNILELFNQYKLKKDLEEKKQTLEKQLENKSSVPKTRKKTEDMTSNSNVNNNQLKKEKEKKPIIKMKISTNMNMENIFKLMKNEKEFEQFVNGFGGYYADNEEKRILTQIKDSNPTKNNLFKIYNEIKTNIQKEKQELQKSKRKYYKTENKSFLNKVAEINYNNQQRKSIVSSNKIDINNNNNDNIIIKDNEKYNEKEKEKVKEKEKNKKIKMKRKDNKSKEKSDYNEKIKSNNNSIENNNIKENSNKEKVKKIYENVLTEQEKEDIINNKTSYIKDKKIKIKNLKNDNGDNGDSDTKKEIKNKVSDFNNKLNFKYIKDNKYLNDFEKEFLIKSNFLTDLNEEDKNQIIKYLEQLEEASEKAINIISNIYSKIKINNIHYALKNFIISILNKINKEANVNKKYMKRKTDYFQTIRSKEFLENQKKIMEIKETEAEEEQNFIQIYKKRNKGNAFKLDEDIDIIFQKGKKRSRSFNIKKLQSYPKIYHNLLFNAFNERDLCERPNSAKKDIKEDEWEMYLAKTSINRRNQKPLIVSKFTKRKRKTNRRAKKTLFVDEYKIEKNVITEKDEDMEIIKDEIEQNKLRKELKEKQLYDFFKKIQALKKGGNYDLEKEIELLIDKQLEKMEYTKEKENENRVNNFMQDFDLNRIKNIYSKKFYSKRMHYMSPINFFIKHNEDNNNNKL